MFKRITSIRSRLLSSGSIYGSVSRNSPMVRRPVRRISDDTGCRGCCVLMRRIVIACQMNSVVTLQYVSDFFSYNGTHDKLCCRFAFEDRV